MKNQYEKDLFITAAYTDRRCETDLYQAVRLVQDGMTELFSQYRCDALALSQSHGVVWAVARTKLALDGQPLWRDKVRMKAFPVRVSGASIHVNVCLETLEGRPLLRARQELCAVDVTNHSLRRVEDTPFPTDLDLLPPVLPEPCRRMKFQLDQGDFVYAHTVRTMDTDMNQHMNNASYVRLLLNSQPSAFWDANRVTAFDIHYAKECREGDQAQVYCRREGGEMLIQIKKEETTLVRAQLILEPREGQ